jgi:hypothetical protein
MSRRIPWHEVRADYVEGVAEDPDGDPHKRSWPTLADVATLHGVSHDVVRKRAAKERWNDQKERFQLDIEQARRRWMLEQRTDRATTIDDRGLRAAEAGLALIGLRLTRLVRSQQGHTEESRGVGLDARELAQLGLASKRFLDVKAHIMGQPSTGADMSTDELERRQAMEERQIAEELAAFLAERAELEAADVAVDGIGHRPELGNGHHP